MLKLHGGPLSNYYCMARAALLEKGLAFEEVPFSPSQDPEYLARSPMGKVPCLETDEGFLTETRVIVEYVDELQPEPPLLPASPFERAKVRELAQAVELYIELVARRGYGALRGNLLPDNRKEGFRTELTRGAKAVARLTRFAPWIAGESYSYADIVAFFSMQYAVRAAKANVEYDLTADLPGVTQWLDRMRERDAIKRTLDAQRR